MANTAAKKITYDGKPVQVESAIRDGSGKVISSTYAPNFTVETTGSGNAVTAVSYANNKITATKGATYSNNAGTVTTNGTMTDGHIVLSKGGTVIKDSGATISTSVADNNTTVPTGKAVKSFVEGKGYTTNTGTVQSVATGVGLTGGTITTTGTISLDGKIIQEDLTNTATKTAVTYDLNSYNCSAGTIHGYELAERITGAEASFTGAYGVGNRPSGVNVAFDVSVRLVRWASTTDYTTRQVLWVTGGNTIYYRWCTNGTWGSWTRAYITDNNNTTSCRQQLRATATAAENRPLLMSYQVSSNTTSNVDNITYRNNSIYATVPVSGGTASLTAPQFNGNLTGNVTGNCSGSAGSVAWSNVSSRPTQLSDFTNDSGFRKITTSTSAPTSSDGADGDIWIQY